MNGKNYVIAYPCQWLYSEILFNLWFVSSRDLNDTQRQETKNSLLKIYLN